MVPNESSSTKEASPNKEVIPKATEEEEEPAPQTNGHIEDVDEKEEVQSEEVKQKEAESTSNASADTQVNAPYWSTWLSIMPHNSLLVRDRFRYKDIELRMH